MSKIKKCKFCDGETNKSIDDFYIIGWQAIQFGNKKIVYACPDHKEDFKKYIHKELMGE
jgi:hypothetical protein